MNTRRQALVMTGAAMLAAASPVLSTPAITPAEAGVQRAYVLDQLDGMAPGGLRKFADNLVNDVAKNWPRDGRQAARDLAAVVRHMADEREAAGR